MVDWFKLSQLFYYTVLPLGTLVTAYFAFRTYSKNVKFERTRWAFSLYEKFYEHQSLKEIRDKLDCESDDAEVQEMVIKAESGFTDYLNFFELVAFLEKSGQLERDEVDTMFDYYLRCMKRHSRVLNFIKQNGYEDLGKMLDGWK